MFAAANFHSIFAAALKGKDQAESSTQRNVQKNILLFLLKVLRNKKSVVHLHPLSERSRRSKRHFGRQFREGSIPFCRTRLSSLIY